MYRLTNKSPAVFCAKTYPANFNYWEADTKEKSGSLLSRKSTSNNQKPPVIVFTSGLFSWGLSAIALNAGGRLLKVSSFFY
jgi:hypothetical protein